MKLKKIESIKKELEEFNSLMVMGGVGHIIVAHLEHDLYAVQLREDARSCVSTLIRFTECEEIHYDGQCEYATARVEINNILIGNIVGHSGIDDFYDPEEDFEDFDDEDLDQHRWLFDEPKGFKSISPDYLKSKESLKENPDKIVVAYHSVDDILNNIALNIIRLKPFVFGERFDKFLKNCVRIFDFNEYPAPDFLKFDSGQEDMHYFITTSFSDENAKVSCNSQYWDSFSSEIEDKVDRHFDNVYFGFDPSELSVDGFRVSDELEQDLCLETLPAIYCTKSYQDTIETFVNKKYAILIISDDMWLFVETSLSGFGYKSEKGYNMFEFDLSKRQHEWTWPKLVSNWNVKGK